MIKERLYQLDLIRFLAALYVVFYHYCYRGFNKDNFSSLEYSNMEFFSKYGYLGVDLFFIISGFVILMSAFNSNIISFVISRVSRLYPAYWVCLIITTIFILFYGSSKFTITPFIFFTNLTMFNGIFEIPYIDGVYWSLLIELKFYFIIGFLLLFGKMKFLNYVIYIWLGLSFYYYFASIGEWNIVLSIINFAFIPSWSSYFVAGMLFFMIWKEKSFQNKIIPISICLILSLLYAEKKCSYLNASYNNEFSISVIFTFVISFYILFFLMSTRRLNFLNKSFFFKFGMLTYPLYLLHQNIGYIALSFFNNRINKYFLLIILITIMLCASYIISNTIEKKLRDVIKTTLVKSTKKHQLNKTTS